MSVAKGVDCSVYSREQEARKEEAAGAATGEAGREAGAPERPGGRGVV